MNNWDYTSKYLQYFVDQGITNPLQTDRALINQVAFADSCNFNNVYIVGLPRSQTSNVDYLSRAQKELIQSTVQPIKMLNSEIMFVDPVYKTVAFGTSNTNDFDPSVDQNLCDLYIVKDRQSRKDPLSIKAAAKQIITEYFSRKNLTLGQLFDVRELTQNLLGISGVKNVYTRKLNEDGTYTSYEGVSFFVWNEQVPTDKRIVASNYLLEDFAALLMYTDTVEDKITVTDLNTASTQTEY